MSGKYRYNKAQHIEPQHGRQDGRIKAFYRWLFADLEMAQAFTERFGGTLHEREIKHDANLANAQNLRHPVSRPKSLTGNEAILHRMRILHKVQPIRTMTPCGR